MNIYIYEDSNTLNLEPIVLTRPSFDLRCGAYTFLERVQSLFPDAKISLIVRDELAGVTANRFSDLTVNPSEVQSGLWLKGPVLWDQETLDISLKEGTILISHGEMVAASLTAEQGNRWLSEGGPLSDDPSETLNKEKTDVQIIRYLWDCVDLNGKALILDGKSFSLGSGLDSIPNGIHLVNPEGVSIGNDCSIKPGVVFDAEDGPIIIGNDVTILSHTYLQGPLFIGDGCLVKAGTRIYGGTSIGPGCKLGGEISESIFQSWSNKQHDGFIGHAYIGEWVNLGADTNNSDLKNSYANVQVTVNGETVDTGSPFAGLYMGDHGKSGINTMFNTGTSIGPGANIVGYGYPSVNIPPLSWSINGKIRRYKIDKFYITAQKVKDRRGQEFTLEEKQLFKLLSVEG